MVKRDKGEEGQSHATAVGARAILLVACGGSGTDDLILSSYHIQ